MREQAAKNDCAFAMIFRGVVKVGTQYNRCTCDSLLGDGSSTVLLLPECLLCYYVKILIPALRWFTCLQACSWLIASSSAAQWNVEWVGRVNKQRREGRTRAKNGEHLSTEVDIRSDVDNEGDQPTFESDSSTTETVSP